MEKPMPELNDERCAILFKMIETLLRDYMSLLRAVEGFANAKDKIKAHLAAADEVVHFLSMINEVHQDDDKDEPSDDGSNGIVHDEDE